MRIVTPSLVETVVYNNRLLTPSMIVAEALKVLEMQFHRDASFDFDAPEKLNGVIQIRKPIRFVTEMRVA